MKNREVNSREYKIMLDPKKFRGNEDKLLRKAQKFWDTFSKAIKGIVTIKNDTFDEKEQRLVQFYDTEDKILYENDYVFRKRTEIGSKEPEVTLKFRHRDRYISQARDMKDKDGNIEDQKFEEDIKPPIFVSLYSFSNKSKIKQSKKLNQLNDPGRLFPDLPKRLGDRYVEDQKLKLVNRFTAYEIAIEGPSFQIDDDPELKCKCALIVWYKKKFTEKPLVAEFSFKYKDQDKTTQENFSGEAAQRAYCVFQILQDDEKLKYWVDPEGSTKTKCAYEYS